jgi:hypothetical protein
MINADGSGLEKVTRLRRLRRLPDVLAGRQAARLRLEPSRRERPGETNLFITEWKD